MKLYFKKENEEAKLHLRRSMVKPKGQNGALEAIKKYFVDKKIVTEERRPNTSN